MVARSTTQQRVLLQAVLLMAGVLLGTQAYSAAPTQGAVAWGDYSFGELGDGRSLGAPVNSLIPSTVKQVAPGLNHTLFLLNDGTVFAAGDNTNGELGNGTTQFSFSPVKVSSLTGIVYVAAGYDATTGGNDWSLAVGGDGTVYAWGDNTYGQLGQGGAAGTPANSNVPKIVKGFPAGTLVTQVSAKAHGMALVGTTGDVFTWGKNTDGQLGNGASGAPVTTAAKVTTGATFAAAGGRFSLLLVGGNPGTVVACGDNTQGELGTGTNAASKVFVATTVITQVSSIAAGFDFAIAETAAGPFSWGQNAQGQLGLGTTANSNKPLAITITGTVRQVSAGIVHAAACMTDNTVQAWGSNFRGQLGTGNTTPSLVPKPVAKVSGALSVACGGDNTLVFLAGGGVQGWGDDFSGQFGDGANASAFNPVQVMPPAPGLQGVMQICGGQQHSLALKADGTVFAFGFNLDGELGNSTNVDSLVPVQVPGLTGVTAIACGGFFSLALKADGSVAGWGKNDLGQLGNLSVTSINTPTTVFTPATGVKVTDMAAGFNFCLFVTSDGKVFGLGDDSFGQLGNGTTNTTGNKTPVQVSNVSNAKGVRAGFAHSIMFTTSGNVFGWGDDGSGQLGDGLGTPPLPPAPEQTTPVQVSGGVSGVTALAAGDFHSLALKSDGTVLAFGSNQNGQCGVGTSGTFVNVPTAVTGLTAVTAIACGGAHSMFLKGGAIYDCGSNFSGQLGNGNYNDNNTATPVSGISNATAIGAGEIHSLAVLAGGGPVVSATLKVTAPTGVNKGTPFKVTVQALDPTKAPLTTFTGTITFTSTDKDPGTKLPADYSFVAADNGTHTFDVTLNTTGSQMLTATDVANSTNTGSATIVVTNATAYVVTAPKTTTHGAPTPITIKAVDATGATVTAYQGTVKLTSSDSAATLPGNYTFLASDNGVKVLNVAFNTTGSQTVTATDTGVSTITGNTTIQVGPTLASLSAAPSPASVGDVVTFTCTTDGGATVTWDFGDGSATSTGSTVTHFYITPGTYTATATAAVGSASTTGTVSEMIVDIGQTTPPPVSGTVKLTKLEVDVDLSSTTASDDKVTISGMITLPTGYATATRAVVGVLGGGSNPPEAIGIFTLSNPGSGSVAGGVGTFTAKITTKSVAGKKVTFTVTYSGNYKTVLTAALKTAGADLTASKAVKVPLTFKMTYGGALFTGTKTVSYKAKNGKGVAK